MGVYFIILRITYPPNNYKKITPKMKLIYISASLSIAFAFGPLEIDGSCPSIPAFSDKFDLNTYLGKWYNIANLPSFFQFDRNTCGTADYELNDNGSINVLNGEKAPLTRLRYTARGIALPRYNEDKVTGLDVRFFSREQDPQFEKSNYNVLDTDNDNFSFVWSCEDNESVGECKWWHFFTPWAHCGPATHKPYLWIITRQSQKTQEELDSYLDEIEDIFAENDTGYDFSNVRNGIRKMKHENCGDYD